MTGRKFYALIALGLMAIGAVSCSGGHEVAGESVPLEPRKQGISDAKALCNMRNATDSEIHTALLAVKSREWDWRRVGDDASADAYISAFREYVAGNDKSMADSIF